MSIQDELQEMLGERGVFADADTMAPYLREWRGVFTPQAAAIARPATAAQVAAVVSACAQAGIGVVPQGGNTGLVGGAAAASADRHIILSLERMRRVREVDTDNDTMTVEAGCILADVQAAAERADRLFPLSLAAEGSCCIGGNLATNAGGVNVLRYGTARQLVLGVEVVLADGRIWNGLTGLRKDNTGFDLKQLFIGSEGTLGIITAAVLKLFPRSRQLETAWVAVPDPPAAVQLLKVLRNACGDNLTACELIPRSGLELALRHIEGCRDPLAARHPWYVLVELSSPVKGEWLRAALESVLEAAFEDGGVLDAALADSLQQGQDFWHIRENLPEAQRRAGTSIKHDVSLPISRLAEFMAAATPAIEQAMQGARVCPFGHLGDGNLHFNVLQPVDADPQQFLDQSAQLNRLVDDIAISMGGSFSAEHGIGRLKPADMARYKAPEAIDLMWQIKRALDPQNSLNPGAVLPSQQ